MGEGIETFGVWVVDRGQVAEVGDLDVTDVTKGTDDRQRRRGHVDGRGRVRARGDVPGHGDTVELLQEVEVEPGPPELAVGHAVEPDRLDPRDGSGDGLVLDGPQIGGGLVPLATAALAARTAAGRRRLPTCSARNGGSRAVMRAV